MIHDNTELTCLSLVNLFESNDIGVIEYLKNFCLSKGRLLVLLTHFLDINLFDYSIGLEKTRCKVRQLIFHPFQLEFLGNRN